MADKNSKKLITKFQQDYIRYLIDRNLVTDHGLAIMAPTTDKDGFRVYSNGGEMARIRKTKTVFLGSYEKYIPEVFRDECFKPEIYSCSIPQEQCAAAFSGFIRDCTGVTEKWAENDRQHHEERRTENRIIHDLRERGSGGIVPLDMEFNIEPQRYGGVSRYGKTWNCQVDFRLRGGRVDLVVYDSKHGFGLIELKYNGESMENIGKHFADFDAAVNDTNAKTKITGELERRLNILVQAGICIASDGSINKNLWYGFLFVGATKEIYLDQIKSRANWKCQESRGKQKYYVDWNDLREAYLRGDTQDPGRYIWYEADKEYREYDLSFDAMTSIPWNQ